MASENEQEMNEKLKSLEEENVVLKSKLESINKNSDDFMSYRLYKNARTQLIEFIGVLIAILTGFGLFSFSEAKNEIVEMIKLNGKEVIVKEATKEVVETVMPDVKNEVVSVLTVRLQPEIDKSVKDNLKMIDNERISSTIKNTTSSKTYYVIALTSTRKSDIENEISRVKKEYGRGFDDKFKNVDIFISQLYEAKTLLVNKSNPLTLEEAKKLKIDAVNAGFSRDTWLWSSDVDYFTGSR